MLFPAQRVTPATRNRGFISCCWSFLVLARTRAVRLRSPAIDGRAGKTNQLTSRRRRYPNHLRVGGVKVCSNRALGPCAPRDTTSIPDTSPSRLFPDFRPLKIAGCSNRALPGGLNEDLLEGTLNPSVAANIRVLDVCCQVVSRALLAPHRRFSRRLRRLHAGLRNRGGRRNGTPMRLSYGRHPHTSPTEASRRRVPSRRREHPASLQAVHDLRPTRHRTPQRPGHRGIRTTPPSRDAPAHHPHPAISPRLQNQQQQRQPIGRRAPPPPVRQEPGRSNRTVLRRPTWADHRLAQPQQRRQVTPGQLQRMITLVRPGLRQRQQPHDQAGHATGTVVVNAGLGCRDARRLHLRQDRVRDMRRRAAQPPGQVTGASADLG